MWALENRTEELESGLVGGKETVADTGWAEASSLAAEGTGIAVVEEGRSFGAEVGIVEPRTAAPEDRHTVMVCVGEDTEADHDHRIAVVDEVPGHSHRRLRCSSHDSTFCGLWKMCNQG